MRMTATYSSCTPYDYKFFILLLLGRVVAIAYCIFTIFGHLISLLASQVTAIMRPFFPTGTIIMYLILSSLHMRGIIKMFSPLKPHKISTSSLYSTYLDYGGVYGRLGPDYEYRLVLRELLEIPAQTYMGYSLSRLSTWTLFPTIYGLIITFNCTVSPTLLYFWKKSELLDRRNTLMMIDAIIDLVQGAIIPMAILSPTVLEFYKGNSRIGDIAWTAKVLSVAQHLVVTSPLDLIASTLPIFMSHLLLKNIHNNWYMMEECLRNNPEIRNLKKNRSGAILRKLQEDYSRRFKKVKVLPSSQGGGRAVASFSSAIQSTSKSSTLKNVLAFCSLVWGIVIFVLVIQAPRLTSCDNVLDGTTCEVPVKPWWSTSSQECHCLYTVINCVENPMLQGKNGNETYELVNDIVLSQQLDTEDTMALLFHGCPFNTAPEAINRFTKLRSLLFSYCTKMKSIPIELVTFPQLASVYLTGSSVGSVPEGFRILPPGLIKIFIRESGINELPPWFVDEWSKDLQELGLGGNNLTAIPPGIGQFKKLTSLNLENNLLKSIPDELGSLPLLENLYLGGNKLTNIPESFLNLPLIKLNIAENEIVTVPWNVSKMLEWNTDKALFLATNNTICKSSSVLSQSPVCAATCSPLCDRFRLSDIHCSDVCNNLNCKFDNGNCYADISILLRIFTVSGCSTHLNKVYMHDR